MEFSLSDRQIDSITGLTSNQRDQPIYLTNPVMKSNYYFLILIEFMIINSSECSYQDKR